MISIFKRTYDASDRIEILLWLPTEVGSKGEHSTIHAKSFTYEILRPKDSHPMDYVSQSLGGDVVYYNDTDTSSIPEDLEKITLRCFNEYGILFRSTFWTIHFLDEKRNKFKANIMYPWRAEKYIKEGLK